MVTFHQTHVMSAMTVSMHHAAACQCRYTFVKSLDVHELLSHHRFQLLTHVMINAAMWKTLLTNLPNIVCSCT